MKVTVEEAIALIETHGLRIVEQVHHRRGIRLQVVDKRKRPSTLAINKEKRQAA